MKPNKTKKIVFISFISLLILCEHSWAGTLGDINGDYAIGLPEAIYALGVTAGLETQADTDSIDFKNYFFVDGAEFFYKIKTYDELLGKMVINYQYAHHLLKELNNQLTFIECWYTNETYQEYYSIENNSKYATIGDYWNGWYDDTIIIGSNMMTKGDIFSSIYTINEFPYWSKYTFLGYEDVETEAGIFKNCIKTSKLNSYKWGVLFSYFSQNIGLVKQVYTSDNESYTLELVGTLNGTESYPTNFSIKRCYGTWQITSSPEVSDAITFLYLPQNGNIGTLILNNFPILNQYKTISLESTDGNTFTSVNSNDTISATITGNSFNGTYSYTYFDDATQDNKTIQLSFSGTFL